MGFKEVVTKFYQCDLCGGECPPQLLTGWNKDLADIVSPEKADFHICNSCVSTLSLTIGSKPKPKVEPEDQNLDLGYDTSVTARPKKAKGGKKRGIKSLDLVSKAGTTEILVKHKKILPVFTSPTYSSGGVDIKVENFSEFLYAVECGGWLLCLPVGMQQQVRRLIYSEYIRPGSLSPEQSRFVSDLESALVVGVPNLMENVREALKEDFSQAEIAHFADCRLGDLYHWRNLGIRGDSQFEFLVDGLIKHNGKDRKLKKEAPRTSDLLSEFFARYMVSSDETFKEMGRRGEILKRRLTASASSIGSRNAHYQRYRGFIMSKAREKYLVDGGPSEQVTLIMSDLDGGAS